MSDLRNLQYAVMFYRNNYRMEDYGLDDVDDLFILSYILRKIVDVRGNETPTSILNSGPMAAVFDDMSNDYMTLLTELQQGDFWDAYAEDCDMCPPYDYNLFRRAIRAANKTNPDIHVTNYERYRDDILAQYLLEYYGLSPDP